MTEPFVLPVTLVTASLLALWSLILAIRVSGMRVKHRISLGDQGNTDLIVRMRTHGNFVEYVPLILILMGLVEMAGGDSTILAVTGAALVLFRLMHAIGMPRPAPNVFRAGGAMGTFLIVAALSIWGIGIVVGG